MVMYDIVSQVRLMRWLVHWLLCWLGDFSSYRIILSKINKVTMGLRLRWVIWLRMLVSVDRRQAEWVIRLRLAKENRGDIKNLLCFGFGCGAIATSNQRC